LFCRCLVHRAPIAGTCVSKKAFEKKEAFKCGTFGAASVEERHLATGDFEGNMRVWDLERMDEPVYNVDVSAGRLPWWPKTLHPSMWPCTCSLSHFLFHTHFFAISFAAITRCALYGGGSNPKPPSPRPPRSRHSVPSFFLCSAAPRTKAHTSHGRPRCTRKTHFNSSESAVL
jgi:hypothetical protein